MTVLDEARQKPSLTARDAIVALGSNESFKYQAFITYSHQDRLVAEWIHKAIERYRVPKDLVGKPGRDGAIPQKLFPLFRDRDELSSSPDLSASIREALSQSAYLVVLCSPAAAKSRWVNEEILQFKRLGRADRIHALIIDGDPILGPLEGGCYPSALRFALRASGEIDENKPVEPLAADIRTAADGKRNAKLKLIAGILGMGFDALRQRELIAARHRRRKGQLVGGSMAALLVLSAFAGYLAYTYDVMANRRLIPGIHVERRETTLDLSGWQETTPDDLATRIKKSMAISKNRFRIARTRKHASNFIHVIGTSSGITPEVRCNGCRMVPRQSEGESRAPNEWDLEFDVSTLPLDEEKEFEFSVIFWNAFQDPKQWWGGFRILHPTVLSLYSIQFPATRRPLSDTFQYLYVDSKEHPYSDEVRSSFVTDPGTGRVAKVTWEVPHPRADRSYRVKWDWNR